MYRPFSETRRQIEYCSMRKLLSLNSRLIVRYAHSHNRASLNAPMLSVCWTWLLLTPALGKQNQDAEERPIMFVCHSLDGNIVKWVCDAVRAHKLHG